MEGEDETQEHGEKWMPDAFRQSSSSSEDDADKMFRSTVRKEKKAAKEHRRKPKPFPLKETDFRSSPSPHNHPVRFRRIYALVILTSHAGEISFTIPQGTSTP